MNVDKATRYHQLRRRAELSGTLAAAAFLLLATFTGAWYQGFLLEHRYGLSTQSPTRWLSDQAKGALAAVLFAIMGAAVVYGAMAWSLEWWWAIAAGMLTIATIVIVKLAPVAILPIFYSFRPLDRPDLIERLLRLASRADTSIAGVFEWRMSDHTRKANAALAGMGRTRRILLSDTLLADYSDDEIEVVLAHELAHHVHHDLWRAIALQTVLLFGGFFAAHVTLTAAAGPSRLGGISDPAGLPVLMLAAGVWSVLFMPIANALSRRHERRADRYALETTRNAEAFVSAMRRLGQQNLAEEHPSRLVQWLFYSHPPIRDRIRAAAQWQQRSG
ncbi:MAG: M48 family metallopeptidase [Acidobacteria bacterium]|nr:M48 family metallopeptidase [Acidobacteriota bacterium]